MFKKPCLKLPPDASAPRSTESFPEIALAAIVSYKKQKEIGDFMSFLLAALDRNSDWLNNVVGKQANFKCALMVGAGPNRFQIQQIIYPTDESELKLEVEQRDSDDFDKIAVAAIMKLRNSQIDLLLKYIKNRLYENPKLLDELLQGKAMGIQFALLRPCSEKQFRIMERIVVGNSMKCLVPTKKRRRDDKSVRFPLKKIKREVH
ncbi:uncharacterized protein LOC126974295 [Leptidea sinapis]|uniref:uncharacterized protein LOC126974295 n=1 Tax=Leptidea sinapis TaxID=189913 RepID=UPI002132799C|nr:uncharacterized protein LOC126974295 [Leptidea sinapis]